MKNNYILIIKRRETAMKTRCVPTQKLLDELEECQKELCLSEAQLAEKIGITWLAFHFLKTGRTANPNSKTLKKIKAFLRKASGEGTSIELENGPGLVKQARKICSICTSYPKVKEELLDEMNNIIRETIQEYSLG